MSWVRLVLRRKLIFILISFPGCLSRVQEIGFRGERKIQLNKLPINAIRYWDFIPSEWEGKQSDHVAYLIRNTKFRPIASVDSGGRTFYLSSILDGKEDAADNRFTAIMYTKIRTTDGQEEIVARLLYKSRSHGGWRSCPYIDDSSHNKPLSKGVGIHYTQETKVAKEIADLLDCLEMAARVVRSASWELDLELEFGLSYVNLRGQNSYESEIIEVKDPLLEELKKCRPGECFKYSKILLSAQKNSYAEFMQSFDFSSDEMKKFFPKFDVDPVYSYTTNHALLHGPIIVEVYKGFLSEREVEWHFASDEQGRVWIDRINFSATEVNSYGVYKEVIDSGFLTNKPLEYAVQTRALVAGEYASFDDMYIDITPLLDHLQVIGDYRMARGIARKI